MIWYYVAIIKLLMILHYYTHNDITLYYDAASKCIILYHLILFCIMLYHVTLYSCTVYCIASFHDRSSRVGKQWAGPRHDSKIAQRTGTIAIWVPEILKPIRVYEGNIWQHLPWFPRSCYSVRRTPWLRSFAPKHQPESQKLRMNADNSLGFSTRESEKDIIM